jgi:carbon storage regulator
MLVPSRKANQKIIIADNITVVVVAMSGDRVKLGLSAPRNVLIHREEVRRTKQHTSEMSSYPLRKKGCP